MVTILDKNEKSARLILLSAFLAMGVFLRIFCLTIRPIWYDEAITIFYAKAGLGFISTFFWHGSNPPFAYYFYSIWSHIFGSSQMSFELVSVMFGILSIWAINQVGKILFSRSAGLIAALFLTFSSYHVFVSQQIRGYSMVCFFSLMSILFFMKFKNQGRGKHLLGWLLFSLLMVTSHFYAVFLLMVEFIFLWQSQTDVARKNLVLNLQVTRISFWFAIVGSLSIFTFLFLMPDLFPIYSRLSANVADIQLIVTSIFFLSTPLVIASALIVISYGALISKKRFKPQLQNLCFLAAWLSVSILIPYFFSKNSSSFFYVRYYIFSHLAWVLLTAAGIDFLFKGMWKCLVSVIFVFLLTFLLSDYYAECAEKYKIKQDYEMVEREFQPGDVVLHENGWTFGPSFYYHGGRIPEFFVTDEFGLPNQWDKKVRLDELTSYHRFWLFVESPGRFALIENERWFKALSPQLVKRDPAGAWYLFEIRHV